MEDDLVCFMVGYIVCIVENWWPQQYDLQLNDNFLQQIKILWEPLTVNQRKQTVITSQWLIRENLSLENSKRLKIPSKWMEYVNFNGPNKGDNDKEDDRGIFVFCTLLFVFNFVVENTQTV